MKKFSFLMSIFIFVSFVCNVSAAVEPEIVSYGFLNQQGNIITVIGNEISIRGYADIRNSGFASRNNLGELVVELFCNDEWQVVQSVTLSVESNTLHKRMVTDSISLSSGDDILFRVYVTDPGGTAKPPVIISTAEAGLPHAENDEITYAEEIRLVKTLEILTGYEDGSFGGALPLTHAELAVVMTRFTGMTGSLYEYEGETEFSDVSAGHWASAYINITTALGILSGYEDGTFAPEEKVDLLQAVTALVNALGYRESVDSGYINKANELNITNGINMEYGQLVSRGTLAKLIANSLEVPLMKNGVIHNEKTILSEVFSITKLKAYVTRPYESADQVLINVINAYNSEYGQPGEIFEVGRITDIKCGETNLISLVGYTVFVYVKYDDTNYSEPAAVYAKKDASAQELTLSFQDIKEVSDFGYYYLI